MKELKTMSELEMLSYALDTARIIYLKKCEIYKSLPDNEFTKYHYERAKAKFDELSQRVDELEKSNKKGGE